MKMDYPMLKKCVLAAYLHDVGKIKVPAEILQKNGTVTIEYKLEKETGKEHSKMFFSAVYFNSEKIGEGSGKTKKMSEQNAARQAIEKIKDKT